MSQLIRKRSGDDSEITHALWTVKYNEFKEALPFMENVELKATLKSLGQKTSGKKADLISRILQTVRTPSSTKLVEIEEAEVTGTETVDYELRKKPAIRQRRNRKIQEDDEGQDEEDGEEEDRKDGEEEDEKAGGDVDEEGLKDDEPDDESQEAEQDHDEDEDGDGDQPEALKESVKSKRRKR